MNSQITMNFQSILSENKDNYTIGFPKIEIKETEEHPHEAEMDDQLLSLSNEDGYMLHVHHFTITVVSKDVKEGTEKTYRAFETFLEELIGKTTDKEKRNDLRIVLDNYREVIETIRKLQSRKTDWSKELRTEIKMMVNA